MTKLTYEVLPGGLDSGHHSEIFDLAEKGWKAARIARRLRKHPATVYWFMLTEGLATVTRSYNRKPYYRHGKLVVPFSADEDVLIEALRIQGFHPDYIAEVVSKRFSVRRTGHAIRVRLVMLATHEAAA